MEKNRESTKAIESIQRLKELSSVNWNQMILIAERLRMLQ
jgi:hypothetical protein